ncbi:unnamed protein product [Moneuplotes crassus]|uniref:Uncharacterized protein n=1 Tax=Euplotes crassus TaxID=5936 RepID=A0AAD1UGV9_EUPCR|nr:unnamed protein product [Moneuplotes crassus]
MLIWYIESQRISPSRLLLSNQEKRTPLPDIQTPKNQFKISKINNLNMSAMKKSGNHLDFGHLESNFLTKRGISSSICVYSDQISSPTLQKEKVKRLLQRLTGGRHTENLKSYSLCVGTQSQNPSEADMNKSQLTQQEKFGSKLISKKIKPRRRIKKNSLMDSLMNYKIQDISIFNDSEKDQQRSRKINLKKSIDYSQLLKSTPRKINQERRKLNRFKRTIKDLINLQTDRKVTISEEFSLQDIMFSKIST